MKMHLNVISGQKNTSKQHQVELQRRIPRYDDLWWFTVVSRSKINLFSTRKPLPSRPRFTLDSHRITTSSTWIAFYASAESSSRFLQTVLVPLDNRTTRATKRYQKRGDDDEARGKTTETTHDVRVDEQFFRLFASVISRGSNGCKWTTGSEFSVVRSSLHGWRTTWRWWSLNRDGRNRSSKARNSIDFVEAEKVIKIEKEFSRGAYSLDDPARFHVIIQQ